MNALHLFATIIALCAFRNSSGEIPSDIQKCHAGDVQCITRTLNDILRKNPNGNKELGLINLEPFHIDEFVVSKAKSNSQLNLDLKLTNLDIYGLSKTNVTRVVGFEKDPRTSKFELYLTSPLLMLRGQYEANGKILVIPVTGKGNTEVRLKNLKTSIKLKMTTTEENGKLRIAISKTKVHNDPELLTVVRLDNPFNGNKAVGDAFRSVINTNWKDIWTEVEREINTSYGQVVDLIISNVLKKVTYDEFYSD